MKTTHKSLFNLIEIFRKQKVNYFGGNPRGIYTKLNINFEASLGVLNPLAAPIKLSRKINAITHCKHKSLHDYYCDAEQPYIS